VCERPQLLEADLVACVSDEVATEIRRFGVPSRRILVSPMSVDTARFSPAVSGAEVRQRYGLEGRFVLGWTGSFRKFHGLDLAIDAFAAARRHAPDAVLLLVGDGQERGAVERQVSDLGIRDAVVFTGGVSHNAIASHVAAMDAAFVVARAAESFHYSPLKLREYLMCGKPVIVPYAGEMARRFHDGEDCLMYTPGDVRELGAAMRRLLDDRPAAAHLAVKGRQIVECDTWDARLAEALRALRVN
jgi:glycosyltransferase involved in cell wall biosynthesis